MSDVLLEIRELSKNYGNLKVLEDINFSLRQGEILGLVGRRGSGKSTLLGLIGGNTQPSRGSIRMKGRQIAYLSPSQARNLGVELVYQSPQLVSQMNVIQNIFLGREFARLKPFSVPDWDRMSERAGDLLADFDLPYGLINESVSDLTDEQRHLVALMRAFSRPAGLLLIDDVLTNLSYHRQEILLDNIREQSRQGVGVIICSENIKHLFNITDRILVLYEGKLVADRCTAESTPREVVELIVGASSPEQITPVIWALENYHKARQQTEELFQKQSELHETLEASDLLNRQLIERLSGQVQAMDRLNLALQETQRRLMTDREEERKAVARELHDSVIQDLLGLNYRLEDIENDEEADEQRKELVAIRKSIRQVVGDLRQICRDLRPPTIDNHGLSSAITSLVQEWADRTGIAVNIDINRRIGRLPEWIELSIFRIIQEGLSNVAKHADARQVHLRLKRTPAGQLRIHIADDGRGIEHLPDLADLSAQKHFGLVGISERVALLDGRMAIESTADKGFELEIEVPIPNPFG